MNNNEIKALIASGQINLTTFGSQNKAVEYLRNLGMGRDVAREVVKDYVKRAACGRPKSEQKAHRRNVTIREDLFNRIDTDNLSGTINEALEMYLNSIGR